MKYLLLKNSQNLLYIELPKEFQEDIEIICFNTQDELENYLRINKMKICHGRFRQLSLEANDPVERITMPDALFVRQNDYFKKIPFTSIKWIEASRSYSYIYVTDKPRIITTHPLSDVKNKLAPELFVQIHRSFVVNRNFVDKFVGNMLYIDNQSFPISKKFRKDVLSRFLFLDNIKGSLEKASIPFEEKEEPNEKTRFKFEPYIYRRI